MASDVPLMYGIVAVVVGVELAFISVGRWAFRLTDDTFSLKVSLKRN